MNNLEKAIQWVNEQEIVADWDYDTKLPKEEVSKLLRDGRKGLLDYECELNNASWEMISYWTDYYRREAAKDFDVDVSELEDAFPGFDANIEQLLRNTRTYIAIDLQIEHVDAGPWEPHFEDYADELEALGVNPIEVNSEWPDIPDRTDPLVSPEDVKEAWANMYGSGTWVALLDASHILKLAYQGSLDDKTHLLAGAAVCIHDFWNGATSTLHRTNRDHEIDPDEVYHDGAVSYGVQATCGLVTEAWNGKLR